MRNNHSPRASVIDGGISVLLLTAVAYLAAFIYEASYLDHFGVPIGFVDVTTRELLLCGLVCIFIVAIMIWLDIFWGAMPRRFPPTLAKALMLLGIVFLGVTALSLLLDAPLPLWAIPAGAIALIAGILVISPLVRYHQLPTLSGKLWAQYGYPAEDDAAKPTILWLSVPKSLIAAIVLLIGISLFAFAIGRCHARVQTQFAIHDLADSCAVVRVSGDGYLCVGIDFHTRAALGTFRFLDPKGIELHSMNVGRITPFAPALQSLSFVPDNPSDKK